MSVNINKIIIQGNVVKDPELKEFTNSKVCKFILASNREFKETKEVLFVDVDVWGNLAELCIKCLAKGKPVLVEGRLKQESWLNKDGQKMNKLTIVANEVIFLSKPGDTETPQNDDYKKDFTREIKTTRDFKRPIQFTPVLNKDITDTDISKELDMDNLPF